MSKSVDELRDYREYLINDIYLKTREEQTTDQTYIDDTFKVESVKDPHVILRSGLGRRMVDSPAEQMVTSNPQVFVRLKNQETEKRISQTLNSWMPVLRRQNPQPFKESIKNKLGRGEDFLYLCHNERFLETRKGLPVKFLTPDPMVVYASPEEDENGVPLRVVVFYERQPLDVISRYPNWKNPERAGEGKNKDKKVSWFEYWDKDIRYFEADSEGVLTGKDSDNSGIQKNIYGIVPFVRARSGFGRRSHLGKMEDLIVSDIRYSRALIEDECAVRSDISSTLHLFAHKPIVIILPFDAEEVDTDKITQELSLGAYDVSVLRLPEGSRVGEEANLTEVLMPDAQVFAYLRDIKAEIYQRNPFLLAGFPVGSSGRQDDMAYSAAMKRFDTVMDNTESQFGTAMEIALKIIDSVPTLYEGTGLNKGDASKEPAISVKLRAEDPIEQDRRATLGSRLFQSGEIDLRTNLTEYQGKNPDEAEEIIVNMLVDKVTLQSPDVAAVMGMEFAREAGLMDFIEEARMRAQNQITSGKALQEAPSPTQARRAQGEGNPEALEMIDMSLTNKGARKPPTRFERTR